MSFDEWWQAHGQYCRAGGGEYEKTFAFRAWEAATSRCIAIVEQQQVPVGNSAAGEMAAGWTMDALREVRDAMRSNAPSSADAKRSAGMKG